MKIYQEILRDNQPWGERPAGDRGVTAFSMRAYESPTIHGDLSCDAYMSDFCHAGVSGFLLQEKFPETRDRPDTRE